ncbi:hypothetical protein [Luteolibacter sp. Populi]|uniref:hypothetical protein n=1 Tax=Luteolibacter sp. Populi TaxID=3230487 RepID=UPI003467B009
MSSAPLADASVMVIDVGGINSVGGFADPLNVTLQQYIAPGAYITGIDFDVVLSAYGTSWLSEFMVDCSESTYTTGAYISPGWGTDAPGLNVPYSGGFDLTTSDLDFYLGSDGILLLTFREASDDPGVNPDGLWVSGTLSITYTVPEASSVFLAMSGCGIALFRRRRSRG